jgi:amidophosphoribosyltransferase
MRNIRDYDKGNRKVASECYYGLYALQHRGQESCGIVVNDDGVFTAYKNKGLVNEVFNKDNLKSLGEGNIAISHVRYSTTGGQSYANIQPLVVNHIKGPMALAHNGNLINTISLREELELNGAIFHSTSDTEVISYIITQERIKASSIEEAVLNATKRIKGAYCLVLMSASKLIAVRDPNGFRPLCIGKTKNGGYIFTSETCALDSVGATFVRDVKPGEIVIADETGIRSIYMNLDKNCPSKTLCVFEFIYFARPDSIIDGSSVHIARQRAGAFLALDHPVQADVVIGVPDSGIDAAIGYSKQSGIPYDVGFIKNKYIGRTFIKPEQTDREDSVRIKLNVISSVAKGKRVVLIDDSIVRGTTCAHIIRLLREAGATEVHMRSSAPPFLFPCYFGTDIDSKENLIANNHTVEEIAKIIGADSLGYLNVNHVQILADNTHGYCDACFSGNYPIDVSESGRKNRFENKISEQERKN